MATLISLALALGAVLVTAPLLAWAGGLFRRMQGASPGAAAWTGVALLGSLALLWPRLTLRPELLSYLGLILVVEMADRLGEANCIQALGDVHVALSEYGEARARYEEARAIYAAIGNRLLEARCLRRRGEILASDYRLEEAVAQVLQP